MFHVVRLKQKLTFVPTLLCAYRYNDGGSQNDNYQQQADTAKVHEPTNGGKHEIVLVVDNNNEPLGDSFQLRRPLCDCDVDFALPLQRENAPMHQTDYLETRQPIRVDILCKGAGPFLPSASRTAYVPCRLARSASGAAPDSAVSGISKPR